MHKFELKKLATKIVMFTILWALLAIGYSPAYARQSDLKEISKPPFASKTLLKPYSQSPVPSGFKNIPFIDNKPIIKATRGEKKRGYVLFSRPITAPVYKGTKPQAWERVKAISSFGTPGEYEPLTFSLYPLRNIRNLRVKVSPLQGKTGTISAKYLDLYALTYWNMRYPMYSSKNSYRAQPELLEKINAINLIQDVCQRFWLKVTIPQNAKPGIYHGSITIYETGAVKAVSLPISLRVLDYKLQRDPNKRYSAYYYPPNYQFRSLNGEALRTAQLNEFKTMRAYGIDMFPVVSLSATTDASGKIQLNLRDETTIELMIKAGFKGPIPVSGTIAPFYRKYVPDGKVGRHWHISKNPSNDKIYQAITRAYRDLKQRAQAQGWPELICCPLDEVAPASAEFSAKVYAAIRRAGVKTFITKNPTAADAQIYRKHQAIDAWCSQPFAMPYEKVIADKQYQYWSYPNHNAGELKDRAIMQKGGRMTYGYGIWRSGYSTLIPWHWRWRGSKSTPPLDYLYDKRVSGCGVRMDKNHEVIPTPYWECFREGYDDLRYLYTLQTAIVQRRESTVPQCQALIKQSKALIQNIWDTIQPQQKYLNTSMWADATFKARRWQIAMLTSALLKYPKTNRAVAPSVMASTKLKVAKTTDSFIEQSMKDGYIDRLDLAADNYKNWQSYEKEVTLKKLKAASGKSIMQFKVKVDYKVDGSSSNGNYPVGWPKISYYFAKNSLNLNKYDYLYFRIKIDSDRSEVADDTTPFVINIKSYTGAKYDYKFDLGGKQRIWLTKIIPLKQLIALSGRSEDKWQNMKLLQLVIFERFYANNTQLIFDIADIGLLKFNCPVIEKITSSDLALLPVKNYLVDVAGFGFEKAMNNKTQITAKITDNQNRVLVSRAIKMMSNPQIILNLSSMTAGNYNLTVAIKDHRGKILSSKTKTIQLIKGYL